MSITKETISLKFREIQDDICVQIQQIDQGHKFKEDLWERAEGGGGRTRVIVGKVIEKGGVNFSEVYGKLPPQAYKSLGIQGEQFFATGVSIVLHPNNPYAPIIHMNIRYFEMDENQWWFGGGIDLTPHYVNPEEAAYFHRNLQSVCNKHSISYYNEFKEWADNYFYIPHRAETRGVGGIFFDRLDDKGSFTKEGRWAFVQDVGKIFPILYYELISRSAGKPFAKKQKEWQNYRRGRYAEFNLAWDRGTKFGLHTGGRTESILMSMPPEAKWSYDHQVETGSPEAFTQEHLKKGIDWISYATRTKL